MNQEVLYKYADFIRQKGIKHINHGIKISREEIHDQLFEFQKDLVIWALRKGKAAVFAMTGTGKTIVQCEWAKHIHNKTGGKVLIVAPLAVSRQTVNESKMIDLNIKLCKDKTDVIDGINITNYEKLDKFDLSVFEGVVLDESSILKSYGGKTKTKIINSFANTDYKLACTATPSPNDYMELGNHAEFLNVMSSGEMLSMYFVHDGGETQKWRLKGHAKNIFWNWVSTWAAVVTSPRDLGYETDLFDLPELNVYEETVIVQRDTFNGYLFDLPSETLQERQRDRKTSLYDRCKKAAEIVNNSDEQFIVWCGLNDESKNLHKLISGSVEVKGSDKDSHKEESMLDFVEGNIKCLVSKPSICGFGMNFQKCRNMIFVGLSDSFEQYYQAVRRCYRFGQKRNVNVYIVISNLEGNVRSNIQRKEEQAENMINEMVKYTKDILNTEIEKQNIDSKEVKINNNINVPDWIKQEA